MSVITLAPIPPPTEEQAKDPRLAAAWAAYVEALNLSEAATAREQRAGGNTTGGASPEVRADANRKWHKRTAALNEYQRILAGAPPFKIIEYSHEKKEVNSKYVSGVTGREAAAKISEAYEKMVKANEASVTPIAVDFGEYFDYRADKERGYERCRKDWERTLARQEFKETVLKHGAKAAIAFLEAMAPLAQTAAGAQQNP